MHKAKREIHAGIFASRIAHVPMRAAPPRLPRFLPTQIAEHGAQDPALQSVDARSTTLACRIGQTSDHGHDVERHDRQIGRSPSRIPTQQPDDRRLNQIGYTVIARLDRQPFSSISSNLASRGR